MIKLSNAVKSFIKGEEGATMVEYGLMIAFIAVVCIAAVSLIGTNASKLFNTVAGTL